jgi:hypothetical protein
LAIVFQQPVESHGTSPVGAAEALNEMLVAGSLPQPRVVLNVAGCFPVSALAWWQDTHAVDVGASPADCQQPATKLCPRLTAGRLSRRRPCVGEAHGPVLAAGGWLCLYAWTTPPY